MVAHFDNDSSVDDFLSFEGVVAFVESDESLLVRLEPEDVGGDLVLVVLDVTSVLGDFGLVLIAEGLSVDNSVLEVGSRKSESLGRNEHVGCLGDLKLEVFSSEESLVGVTEVEAVDLVREAWKSEVCVGSDGLLGSGGSQKEGRGERILHWKTNGELGFYFVIKLQRKVF